MSGKFQAKDATYRTDDVLMQFADLIIDRMVAMREKGQEWEKGWFSSASNDVPRNVGGRAYSSSNSFLLQLLTQAKGWQVPVFLTFNQAHDYGAAVRKGEKSWPVIYWNLSIKDEIGRPVPIEKFRQMSLAEQAACTVIPFLKYYRVFNVDQTNLPEVKPELVEKLKERYNTVRRADSAGMYVNDAIDRMVTTNEWVCPIYLTQNCEPCYRPSEDAIHIPQKHLFANGTDAEAIYAAGQEYYSTMLHEMTHSTGHQSRLNRLEKDRFGGPKYAKEELVAEFTAALVGHTMGFNSKITDNNAAYLNGWIDVLKQEPRFLCSVLADVDKASKIIFEHVDKQRIALGQEPYKATPVKIEQSKVEEASMVASVYPSMNGNLNLNVPGYPVRTLTHEESQLWLRFSSEGDREKLIRQFTGSTMSSSEPLKPHNTRERSLSMAL